MPSPGTRVRTPSGRTGLVIDPPAHIVFDDRTARVWVRVTVDLGPQPISVRAAYHPRDVEVAHD